MSPAGANLAYLVASILFILTFRGLTQPRTALRANGLGALGMLVAVVATLGLLDWSGGVAGHGIVWAGLALGAAIGVVTALRVQMTAMPQMVALLNGLGGGASTLVAGAALLEQLALGKVPSVRVGTATVASGIIGAVTFWGSLVAYGKLDERLPGRPIVFPGQQIMNGLLLGGALLLGAWLVVEPEVSWLYWAIVGLCTVLGVTLVLPVGGADMPVVVSPAELVLGLAACATGFVLDNNVLIIAGSLVGASGIILTGIMCRAMNRSLANVLFGGVGAEVATGANADAVYAGRVKSASAEEVAMRTRVGAARGHRARLRHGRRPGAARRAGPGTEPSSRAARRSSSPSIPWRAACPAT